MSEAENKYAEGMAEAVKDMTDHEKAVALAFLEGMQAQKQMQKDAEPCRS